LFHVERRTFLQTFVGGIATAAAVRTWPFRVYSFPSTPVITSATARALKELIRRVTEDDDLWQDRLISVHWQAKKFYCGEQFIISPPELAGMRYIKGASEFQNLSRSPKPFRVGVT